ncbi:hypothetical protein E1262_21460 [Jiangella aurantiaca]|uniref:Succinate dehydrogenase n=1 Tax=Jiangella aurantiaca TaxID=2530373 RepID=A0A4V2YRK8_9ACTN|nr:hypothetical protein [Jiangella aurantiaca]TDD66587.1 hypothetical protein E1262_21460 [Jiangella aurantiaca]
MAAPTGIKSPTRARIAARTLRTDRWWLYPTFTALVLLAFVVYATYRAFVGEHYFAEPYLTPFYSPCVTTECVEGSSHLGTWVGDWWALSPAVLILIIPLSLRLTCYYYRKAYYRSFWMSPPACAVGEPHRRYTGEARFPLILQNIHRYALYLALAYNVLLTYDAVMAFKSPEGEWGHMGLGTLILVVNAVLLGLYSLSCHSCRHIIGGRLRNFSKHPVRYRAWGMVSLLNGRHAQLAWVSLVWVAFTDFYIWMVASGTWSDPRFF